MIDRLRRRGRPALAAPLHRRMEGRRRRRHGRRRRRCAFSLPPRNALAALRRPAARSTRTRTDRRARHVSDRRIAALQSLHALGQRLEREVGIGPHHARERDLERQARVRGCLQLSRQVPQHAQQARQAVGTEQRQLACQLATHGIAHLKRHIGANQRHHVQVPRMLGQIARELREVGARLHELRRPAEARGHVARADGPHDLSKVVRVHPAEHALGHFERHPTLAERDELFERGERVAHAAFGPMRDEVERLALELHAFRHAHRAQTRHERLLRDAPEVEALAARVDRLGHLLRIGGGEDEHHVARRLLERLQQRVERRRGQHVHLVDDVDLVAPARGGELHAADDLLAHILHAGAARGVQFVDVGMLAGGDHRAVVAGAVGFGRGAVLAQKRLGQQTRRRGLARAARAGEQVGVAHLVLLDGVFDGALDMLLADHVLEDLRSVFPIQCFRHGNVILHAHAAGRRASQSDSSVPLHYIGNRIGRHAARPTTQHQQHARERHVYAHSSRPRKDERR